MRFHAIVVLLALAAPAAGRSTDAATSPDGRWRAEVRPAHGPAGAAGSPATALWITDTRTGRPRLLFRGHDDAAPRRDTTSIAAPRFSLDGGFVYVEAEAYATSPAIHQIALRTGADRYVTDGGLVGVLRTGPWRGFLLAEQHREHATGGSTYPVVVVRPDGPQVATVPGRERLGDRAVAPWLRAKGWRAD